MQTDEHGYAAQRRMNAHAKGIKWEAITPHDTNSVARQYKDVLCTVAGTAVIKDTAGTTITLTLVAGALLPVIPTVLTTASTGTFYGIIE